MPGGEIYLAVQTGKLDGAEFSSPGIDWTMGFAEITKYWSVPCWFQPSSQVGTMVNLKAYSTLSKEYKAILRYGCMAASLKAIAFYEGESARAVQKFKDAGTEIYPLPKEDIAKMEKLAGQYCIMKAKESKAYAEVLKSQMDYLKQYKEWRTMSGDFGFGRTPAYVDNVLAELKKLGY
jgi:TRAP-type mannitol/chloroaromatic compound transport system substrate-binding protein